MKNIKLKAISQFSCLGAQCPQNCCIDFQVDVDAKTRKSWKQLAWPDKNPAKLADSIKTLSINNRTFYKLELVKDNRCVLLDDNNLCQVQSGYGHDALPKLCREYPRFSQKDKKVQVHSAALSCPEIARLVLSGQIKPLFEFGGNDLFVLANTSTNTQPAYEHVRETLAGFVSFLMKQNDYGLNVKLFYQAFMVTRYLDMTGAQGYTKQAAQEFLDVAADNLSELASQIVAGQIAVNPVSAGSYWKMIYQWSLTRNVNFDWLTDCNSQFFKALVADDNDHAHFASVYEKLKPLQQKVMQKIKSADHPDDLPHAFERYVTVSLINKGFPLYPFNKHFLATLVYTYSVIALVQLYVWLYYDVFGKIDLAAFTKIVYHIEHVAGQTDKVYQQLSQDSHMLGLDRYADIFLDVFA